MKTKTLSLMVLVLGVILVLGASQAFAQTRPEYIPLGGGVKGVLYRPDSNPSPNVAVIIIHRTANYLQHDAFVIFRTSARLSDFSTGVHRGTLEPRKLLKNDGSIDGIQIVNTVRVPDPGNKQDDEGNAGIQNLTITSFLSASAIRSKHSLDDIDWCSSNNSTVCAVREISVPTLVMTMQGHYFIRDGEQIYEESASADKDFVVVEGAIHNLDNCTACAAFHGTGPYTNVPLNLWNYVANWANARF